MHMHTHAHAHSAPIGGGAVRGHGDVDQAPEGARKAGVAAQRARDGCGGWAALVRLCVCVCVCVCTCVCVCVCVQCSR